MFDSLHLSQMVHGAIRHARSGRALLSWQICGERVRVLAYSKQSYTAALELLAANW